MTQPKDSGRFVFQSNEQKTDTTSPHHTTPSKPDNMTVDTPESERFTPDGLYTYSMGISEIQAHNHNYATANAFVTRPIRLNENVLQVTLDSLEEHPVFEEVSGRASSRQTSVEYYLSLKEVPGVADWHPILPRETDIVRGERLFLDGRAGETLFPFHMESVSVYRDGVRLSSRDYDILNTQAIEITQPVSQAIYTVDYEPNTFIRDPYTFEVNDYKFDTERKVEEFPEGTDINKTLTLSHVPYINKTRIVDEERYDPNISTYRPIDVSITEANIRTPNGGVASYVPPKLEDDARPHMVNRTLYLDNSWSQMNRYDLETGYLGLDYYQHKNKITLAEHINVPLLEENERETPGTGMIRVEYDALVTAFRLKIILRRNTQQETTATPKVKDYTLNFKATR